MKPLKFHNTEPTAEELMRSIFYWYMIGIMGILSVIIILEWLIK